jgi:rhodanese-related sulfurtransferase
MSKKILTAISVILAGMFTGCTNSDAQQIRHVSVEETRQLLDTDTNIFLLDVRTPEEYADDGHLPKAHLIPLDALKARIAEVPANKTVIAYCRTGRRSMHAAELLGSAGITNATMDGGMMEWSAKGYPIEKGK